MFITTNIALHIFCGIQNIIIFTANSQAFSLQLKFGAAGT